ncbi:MAG: lysophospholipid acyltransferase family protein [Alphaproteobacteria bacterium]|nr:lysophospholipid acyltransferase family protein [Alphaproteobacteria bacterium]
MKNQERMWTRIRQSQLFIAAVSWIGAQFLKLMVRSIRWKFEGTDEFELFLRQRKAFIVSVWHSRFLMSSIVPLHYKLEPYRAKGIASRHRDGRLVAEVARRIGVGVFDGSTGKGGEKAALAIMRENFANGEILGITSDGPRGPARRCGPGIIFLASKLGIPVFPIATSVKNAKIFNSWDRFMLPIPFNRGIFAVGPRLEVPPDIGKEEIAALCKELADRMNALEQSIDLKLGVKTNG